MRRSYSAYTSYRRRRRFHWGTLLRILAALIVLAAIGFAGYMIRQALVAGDEIAALEAKNTALQTELDELRAAVPDPDLLDAVNRQSLTYQTLYPEMKVDPAPTPAAPPEKTVYLTFDDGPSRNTATILDALKATGQKATFFVIGKNIAGNEALLQRMVAEGHTIGIHTYSHDYNAVYTSVEAFLEDFHQTYQAIYDACGVYPTVFRFPGGSINAYNRGVYQQLIAEMLRRGFVYYDWSVSSEDAANTKYSASQIADFVLTGVPQSTHPIVLMHDGPEKTRTAEAVPTILSGLTNAGYTCAPLTGAVQPVTFNYSE